MKAVTEAVRKCTLRYIIHEFAVNFKDVFVNFT